MPISRRAKVDPRRYVSSAIPYVNGAPHVGFALELIQADVLARFYRLTGNDVRFQTGTDENSLKNVHAADIAGLSVATLVEQNASRFLGLKEGIELSIDDFIRTSADPRHRPGVERLWNACSQNGDIYKHSYRGLYCVGCEQFFKANEVPEGRCPEHGIPLEEIYEENWFFKLSRYRQQLLDLYTHQRIEIVPKTRLNEILGWIDGELEDISVSRSAERARGWGIPVPGDPDQVIYVWFDALANYITALDFGTDAPSFARFWTNATSREHFIGKGITRFHAVYWPAMLLSAGLALPTRILVHGYVTVEGKKIGKSVGNSIDPLPLAAEFGADALRYFLLRHIRSTGDGDFSVDRFRQAYTSELAGQLGNLIHRVLSMIEHYCDGRIPQPPQKFLKTDPLIRNSLGLTDLVSRHLEVFALDDALNAIWSFVADSNRYVTETQPWALARAAKSPDVESAKEGMAALHSTLYSLAFAIHAIGRCIAPFLPTTAQRIRHKLGDVGATDWQLPLTSIAGSSIEVGAPLFPTN